MKELIRYLADKPIIFDTLRRIIEADYVSLKDAIKKEFSLGQENGKKTGGKTVLDIPCGTGEFCGLFDPESYYGLDISDKYIEYARKKYKHRFICGDAMQSGFDDDYFDRILTLGFLHHLDNTAVQSVLKESKRILKPDGILLLIEDAPTSSRWNIIGKLLQKCDVGSNIRPAGEYRSVLEKDFTVKRYYHVKSGFWDYSVFVLLPKK